jgi:hypothetical protein
MFVGRAATCFGGENAYCTVSGVKMTRQHSFCWPPPSPMPLPAACILVDFSLKLVATEAFMRAKAMRRPLEVEVRTLQELEEVLQILDTNPGSMITRLMLDNMTRKDPLAPSECGGGG